MNKTAPIVIAALVIVGIGGAATAIMVSRHAKEPVQSAAPSSEEQAVRAVVADFGAKLQFVPLAGSEDIIRQAIQQYYAPFVSAEVLAAWKEWPTDAPGRFTSSPWPDRIEITSLQRESDGAYTVQGKIIEVAHDANGETALVDSYLIAMKLRQENGRWIITGFSEAVPHR